MDLLIVLDTTNSMDEEQQAFAAALPALFDALTDPSLDPDHPPVEDMHVAVITGDMGTGGAPVPTCDPADFGDDGVLWSTGDRGDAFCRLAYSPPYVLYDSAGVLADFAHHVQCLLAVGTGGCGFQQPLEAALKALTPSTSDLTFHDGTRGHGDEVLGTFVRSNSLLAVVFVTDDDDCSAADAEVFNASSTRYSGALGLRCFNHPEALHPLERFVAGLRALRAPRPDLLALAFVAGIPVDLEGRTYDDMLADPRMEQRPDDGAATPRLVPSCDDPLRGSAFPPRRLITLAKEFPGQSTVHSICSGDGTTAARGVATLLRSRACDRYEVTPSE